MIYINDIPSAILSMETEQRLLQLGCAVTAGKTTASSAGRMSRRAKAKQSALSGGGRAFAIAYGKAQSDE
jgi:hypothetical protein